MPLQLPPAGESEVDLAALGECSLDYVGLCQAWPGPDEKVSLASLETSAGGQAATAALACRRLGWRSRFVGTVGDDEAGTRALAGLRASGVDVRVIVKPGVRSRQAIVLADPARGTRAVLEARDPLLTLVPSDVQPAWIATSRLVLVDATFPAAAITAADVARRAGRPVLVDVDTAGPEVSALLARVDVVIVSSASLEGLVGTSEPGEASRRIASAVPAGLVVVTLGREGALALASGREIRSKAPNVSVRDTVGAGDAFRGGFAAGWLRFGPQAELETVMSYANAVAALNCRELGAQRGLPTPAEVERLM
ncbi:MAG TPA: carbohydrate kinase family protein [Vicinamibacterales bacterium]|nr:carbohydrate kinase family protein [Vicinamibacterales bacterium]